jgi:tRNA acetyltransferase TAN1
VLFFKTVAPVDPAPFVLSFCKHIASDPQRRQTRAVRRLTPVTLTGKASENGVDEVARKVLAPHFHSEGTPPKKVSLDVIMV